MKNIFFLFLAISFFSCNSSEKKQTQLSGNFKYVAYRSNDSHDSVGISLVHYFEIYKNGDYKMIWRDSVGNAIYYYGFVDKTTLASLIDFSKEDAYASKYMSNDSNTAIYNGPTYLFDYMSDSVEKQIMFIPPFAPNAIKSIQSKLDSVINMPGKKQSAAFNINDYLKKIISEDTAGRQQIPVK